MFYVQEVREGLAYLRGETAQHIRKVLRAERGQRFEISDGEELYLAELKDFGKDVVEFRLVETLHSAPVAARIHLLQSLIKFDHFEWVLEKATELGVERITPVYSLRCDKGLDQAAVKRRERWLRIVAESGQQCRRLKPPALDEPVRLKAALAMESPQKVWLEEEAGAPGILSALVDGDGPILVLCGPEGGWDPRERDEAKAGGWQAVSLGRQVLRAETAALSALAVISAFADAKKPRV
jgi:16S rRNA (uracil1498-N3)-methyltransferase